MIRIRDEIENIVKKENLDRKRIFEVSHLKYRKIIDKIIDTFLLKNSPRYWHYTKSQNEIIHWANIDGRINASEYVVKAESEFTYRDLADILPDSEPFYVLLEDWNDKYWLYEMYAGEIVTVLDNLGYGDYYIVSKKFNWLISEDHHQGIHFAGDIAKKVK